MVKEVKEVEVKEVRNSFWNKIEGKKSNLTDTVDVEFAGEKATMEVQFVEVSKEQKMREVYEDMKPAKPTITKKIGGVDKKITVPNQDKKWKTFNNDPEAKEKIAKWNEDCEPFERKTIYRLAHEFLLPKYRVCEDAENAVEWMDKNLDYMSAVKIVNVGHKLNNISSLISDSKND